MRAATCSVPAIEGGLGFRALTPRLGRGVDHWSYPRFTPMQRHAKGRSTLASARLRAPQLIFTAPGDSVCPSLQNLLPGKPRERLRYSGRGPGAAIWVMKRPPGLAGGHLAWGYSRRHVPCHKRSEPPPLEPTEPTRVSTPPANCA
jgi:hypothetical protein